jgi:hypothetical protein
MRVNSSKPSSLRPVDSAASVATAKADAARAHEDRAPRADVLAIHVMNALTRARVKGRVISLEDVALEVGARKVDVRRVVTALDRQGLVDAARMRPTLLGFAIGRALRGEALRTLRGEGAQHTSQKSKRPLRAAA